MSFSDPVFLFLFLPSCLIAFHALRQRDWVLLTLSLCFYAWGEPALVWVMIGSIVVNFLLGRRIALMRARPAVARAWLAAGVTLNLCLLVTFKYLSFLLGMLGELAPPFAGWSAKETGMPSLLGVSFFTFQAMSYLVDVYRGDYEAERNLTRFALFKVFFPQLISGPIVRYAQFAPQFDHHRVSLPMFAQGVERFIVGLAKKVMIADVCGASVDRMFAVPAAEMPADVALAAALLFGLQIFFDFSGYSDMAIGLARMFGFRLPENFAHPYAALSMQDFWRRWHITLSTWFRDYLYIPLGGNRHGRLRTAMNLLVVFALCGLWHGANWTFLIWGLLHGAFLGLERTWFGRWLEARHTLIRRAYVTAVVFWLWTIFRSPDMTYAAGLARAMVGLNGWSHPGHTLALHADTLTLASALIGIVLAFGTWHALDQGHAKRDDHAATPRLPMLRASALCALLLASFAFVGAQTHRPFIYFQF